MHVRVPRVGALALGYPVSTTEQGWDPLVTGAPGPRKALGGGREAGTKETRSAGGAGRSHPFSSRWSICVEPRTDVGLPQVLCVLNQRPRHPKVTAAGWTGVGHAQPPEDPSKQPPCGTWAGSVHPQTRLEVMGESHGDHGGTSAPGGLLPGPLRPLVQAPTTHSSATDTRPAIRGFTEMFISSHESSGGRWLDTPVQLLPDGQAQ